MIHLENFPIIRFHGRKISVEKYRRDNNNLHRFSCFIFRVVFGCCAKISFKENEPSSDKEEVLRAGQQVVSILISSVLRMKLCINSRATFPVHH